jgi:hypothetical protein
MTRLLGFVAAAALACNTLYGQSGGVASEVKQAYESVKNNLMKTAEKVPEEDYSFKPTPDIRTFAEVMQHVISAQMHSCGAVAGEQKSIPSDLKTKSAIVDGLREAFAECDKAYGLLTDANMTEAIRTPRGQHSRIAALMGNTTHDAEQYGILSVYLRLKGIIPPSSEHAGPR